MELRRDAYVGAWSNKQKQKATNTQNQEIMD